MPVLVVSCTLTIPIIILSIDPPAGKTYYILASSTLSLLGIWDVVKGQCFVDL